MNLEQTLNAFDEALNEFLENDFDLLERKLSERSITNKLAFYITCKFKEFDVDCEYNGDVENLNGFRKTLKIDRYEMISIAVRKIDKLDTYSVFPDIIVHSRKRNDNNHLVIEIKKKESNPKEKEYDLIKLQAFTNQYKYRLGIFLELKTGKEKGVNEIKYYQNGKEVEKTNLKEIYDTKTTRK